jgi:GNAT superfamily N-acetyltransferase
VIDRAELRAMQGLAQEVWRLRPELVDLTMGQLAYQGAMAGTDAGDASLLRTWTIGGDAFAWGWLSPPGTLEWQVHPDRPQLLEDVLDWFEAHARVPLRTQARDGDVEAQARLRARGFEPVVGGPLMRLNVRDLEEIEEPRLPGGYRFRTMAEYGGDLTTRVAVHREAWAELGTRVTQETYPAVMATWPYRPELDFVVEDSDGCGVAFALGWYDEANRVGEFEPVGTVPQSRRLGLGRAVNLFGLQRFRDAGATRAIVGCRGDEGHPIPCRLYESVGFRELSRQRRFAKPAAQR